MDEGDPTTSALAQMAADVTASRRGYADMALPISPLLATAFPWAVELEPDRPPISLQQLSDVRFVHGLAPDDRHRCWAAVRYALDAEVKYGQLPKLLMDAPINAEWDEEVRSFLSTRGWSRDRQPLELTVEHARAYIGRRTNRLLELLPTRGTTGSPLPDEGRIRLLSVPAWFQLPTERVSRPARRATAQPSSDAVDVEKRRLRKAERRKGQLDDLHWHMSRLHQSEEVHVAIAGGLSISAQDPRLGRLLLEIDQHVPLRGQSIEELTTLTHSDQTAAELVGELAAQVARMQELNAGHELRELLEALLPERPTTKQSKVRSRDLVAARYGLSGTAMTLQEVGDHFGLTRERVRQLQETFDARLSVGTVFAPRLERVRAELAATDSCPLSVLRERLQIHLGNMPLESALDVVQRVLGWPLPGRIAVGQRNPLEDELHVWTQDLTETAVSSVMQQAYAMSTMVGAFLVTAIIGLVAEHAGRFVSRDQIHQILGAWEKAHWIDEESGWGWVDGVERSTAVSDIRKILAVAHPISVDIAVLYAGLSLSRRQAVRGERMNRFSGLLAPRWVLDHILRQLPEFAVAQQDNFRLRSPVDPVTLMEGDTEQKIYAALNARGGLASWQELRDELVGRQGMNVLTFGVVLKNRCWVDQAGYGVYCFRGLRFEIEQVRARGSRRIFAAPSVRATQNRPSANQHQAAPRLLSAPHGSVLEMTIRMTSMSRESRNRVINIPRDRRSDDFVGDYSAKDGSGRGIHVGRTQVTRLADELEDCGIAPGEAVCLLLDRESRSYSWTRPAERST